ncbi:hypothetical protein RclHR1_13930003 [Rhizophagus clarus]|uniref:BED-type domain-containing protein n=1 Tax=Rhizophagus clarus TaxID=94130 RepID=A0A2Z6QFT2_9GLOM|nr:hypothetical protein RclHR1_13930003 [Rhizophagus clarus]GES94135.1 hypothetical protein GLOIN_2v1486080 [Rhizophagus clarus]
MSIISDSLSLSLLSRKKEKYQLLCFIQIQALILIKILLPRYSHNYPKIKKSENPVLYPTVVTKVIPLFFHIDENDSELMYCKICEYELSGLHKKPYAYTRKGGNTSSMISHLRDKHGIMKDNFTDFLDEHREV